MEASQEKCWPWLQKVIGVGKNKLFWTDWFVSNKPLKRLYPTLYNLCRKKELSVYEAYGDGSWNLPFRWNMKDEEISKFSNLRGVLDLADSGGERG